MYEGRLIFACVQGKEISIDLDCHLVFETQTFVHPTQRFARTQTVTEDCLAEFATQRTGEIDKLLQVNFGLNMTARNLIEETIKHSELNPASPVYESQDLADSKASVNITAFFFGRCNGKDIGPNILVIEGK